ncbi:MAG: efflux RND transporter periplasmic adaptor subunit [Candidatus Acidiferrales bacterium]
MDTRSTWAAAAVALGLAAAACGSAPEASKPPAAPVAATTPAVSSPAVQDEASDILTVLSVEREVDLLAQREGVVMEILSEQGDSVEMGAVLARLDDSEVLAQLDRARADLKVAENNVKYSQAEVKAREAAYRRAQEMRELGLNSDADLEEAEFRAVGSKHDLDSWRAAVDRVRADLRKLEVDLERTRLRAPFSGVVARRLIRPGQNVRKDDTCFRVSQLAPLQVRFLVAETSPRQPHEGDSVNVVAVTSPERVYTARIRRVSPVVDAASGGIEVMAELSNPDLRYLRPGMAVKVLWAAPPGAR